MKLFNSRLATVAAAAVIVIVGGGAGANAAGLIDGSDIQNGSITSVDVDNGTIRSADIVNGEYGVQSVDIRNNSIRNEDLDPSVKDGIVAELKADQQLDSKGALVAQWQDQPGADVVTLPGTYTAMVSLDVQTTGSQPVKVQVGDVFCVAVPTGDLGGQCSASRLMTGGQLTVTGDTPEVSVQVSVVRVD